MNILINLTIEGRGLHNKVARRNRYDSTIEDIPSRRFSDSQHTPARTGTAACASDASVRIPTQWLSCSPIYCAQFPSESLKTFDINALIRVHNSFLIPNETAHSLLQLINLCLIGIRFKGTSKIFRVKFKTK